MIALTISFWEGDRTEAMRLCRMIADIEDTPRDDVTVILLARYDTPHDEDTIAYMRRKFPNIEAHASTTQWSGWPTGPNGMARDLLLMMESRIEFDGVIMLEPDCVPLTRHWLNILIDEWQQARAQSKVMMGSWRNSGCPGGHINGNAFIIPQLATFLRKRGLEIAQTPKSLAWDVYVSPFLREHWSTCGRILNKFQSRNASVEDLETPELGDHPPCLVHGYKDSSAFDYAVRKLKLEAPKS